MTDVRLPPRLEPIARALLDASADSRSLTLDAVGEAIGTVPVSTEEVDVLLTVLEAAGRVIIGPEGQRGERNLRLVLGAARELSATFGRRPTIAEIAAHTRLAEDDVRHALALGSVIGR